MNDLNDLIYKNRVDTKKTDFNYQASTFRGLGKGYLNPQATLIVSMMDFKSSNYKKMIDSLYDQWDSITMSIDVPQITKLFRESAINPMINNQNYSITVLDYKPVKYFSPEYAQDAFNKIKILSSVFVRGTVKEIINAKNKILAMNIDGYCRNISELSFDGGIVNSYKDMQDIPTMPIYSQTLTNINLDEIIGKQSLIKENNLYRRLISIVTEVSDLAENIQYNMAECRNRLLYTDINNTSDMVPNIKKVVTETINKFVYKANCIIDAILKYISKTYVIVMKVNFAKVSSILNLASELDNIARMDPSISILESGAFTTILPTDDGALVNDLLNGKNTAYQDLSDRIYEYHKTVLTEIDDAGSNEYPYDKEVYDNITKALDTMYNGFDMLLKFSDDFIDSFNNIALKSGLLEDMQCKYKTLFDALDNISKPSLQPNKMDYYKYVSELKDYGYNTRSIAFECKRIGEIFNQLSERYDTNENTEFANLIAIKEIKKLMIDKRSEFDKFINTLANKLMERLKALSVLCNDISDKLSPNEYDNPMTIESTELDEYFYDTQLALFESILNDNMEDIQRDFYMEKYKQDSGYNSVYYEMNEEPDDASSNNNTNNKPASETSDTDNNKEKEKTTPSVSDNSEDAQTASKVANKSEPVKPALMERIKKTISAFFDKMITGINNFLNRCKGRNLKWLKEHKDYLISRSYSNVEAKILPYEEGMPANNVSKDINTIIGNIKKIDANTIVNITSQKDMYQKLFSHMSGAPFDNEEKFKEYITAYTKVGTKQPLTVETYANNNLKTLVTSTIIPYCEKYYDTYAPSINTLLKSLDSTLENTINQYTNAPTNTSASSTTNTGTNNGNSSDETGAVSLQEKISWMQHIILFYAGKVTNAHRDRCNDYFKLLTPLAKSKTAVEAENNADNAQTNDENNAPDTSSSESEDNTESTDNDTNNK